MLPAPTALAVLAAVAALGCEDGPAQTYSPSPGDAGNIWNNGNVAPASTDAGQSFEAGYPVQSKTVLCDTDFKRQRWAWMLTQPIQPPRKYAGIDLAKDDQWDGLTISDAESPPATPTSTTGGLCQSVPQGYEGTCPSGFGGCNGSFWGNNAEVSFSWNVATYLIDQMVLNLGYTGTMMTNAYPDHTGAKHSWTVAIGDIVRRDGAPFELNWSDTTAVDVQITDIYNAVMATFAPAAGVPFDTTTCTADSDCTAQGQTCQCDKKPGTTTCSGAASQCGQTNCGTDGNCLVYNDGTSTIFGIRPMVVYVEGASGVPQPALSTPTLIYNFFSKWEPFSNLPQVIKLDAEGPVSQGVPVGVPVGATTYCKQTIGQTFSDFASKCVQVTGNSAVDTVNLNKVTHSLTHDQEHWTANVLGVNQNFTSLKVANNPSLVVLDSDAPQPGDLAQDWTFDVRARGAVSNDYGACSSDAGCQSRYGASSTCVPDPGSGISYCTGTGVDYHVPGPLPTLQGSALVYIEWARLMLADIAQQLGTTPRTLGDPLCTGFTGGVPNYQLNKGAGCSGIEGLIIPNAVASYGPPAPAVNFTNEPGVACPGPTCLDPGANADIWGIYPSMLKPGTATGAFCIDPGTEDDCTFNGGYSIFQNALQHVTRVLGTGDVLNLPVELRDRRYYFKWFGIAYVKYLKAYGNYAAKYGAAVTHFPNGVVGGGIGPTDVKNQQIDLESLFFDNYSQAGIFDKFEYIDRDSIGQGSGGAYNFVPWDFAYGCDLFGGNQRYDDWYRRMDREEIAMFASMLTDKTHTAGQENNVNITNLFGSTLLGGNAAANVDGLWPSYACAIGQAGDPAANCVSNNCAIIDTQNVTCLISNAPLDTTNPSGLAPCNPDGSCTDTNKVCGGGYSFTNGYFQACGTPCDFSGANPAIPVTSGCQSPSQTCAFNVHTGQEACLDMAMDKNGPNAANPTPLLAYYPAAWSRSPFSSGHSPITLAATDKHPDTGVATITIPNFLAGPYTQSPVQANGGVCPTGFTISTDKQWCNAALNTGASCDIVNPPTPPGSAGCNAAPSFTPLTPWLEVQPAVGFSIPLDAQHSQWVATGQLDFTGVLETYIVDYLPWHDPLKSSCVADGVCNAGYTCDPQSHGCVTDDNTLQIAAIEGQDFLGQAFLCYDPLTFDVLHVGMYDTALSIQTWLANHPGGSNGYGVQPSAQSACQILIIRSPYDNYIDSVVSRQYGVSLNISGGQGQGRVTDVVLFDPGLIQSL
jgi:hypothetical protein